MIGAFAAFALAGLPTPAEIERAVDDAGAAAPLAFIALYAVLMVVVFPASILTAAAGLLFGTLWGTALSVVGATAGALAAFTIGRRLGRREVERIAGRRITALDGWLERNGLAAILYLRLIPVVPFSPLSYAAGVSALGRRDYLIGTAVGIIPGAFAYAALGGSLDDPASPQFLGAVALVVALAIAGPLVNRALRRRGRGVPEDRSEDPEPIRRP